MLKGTILGLGVGALCAVLPFTACSSAAGAPSSTSDAAETEAGEDAANDAPTRDVSVADGGCIVPSDDDAACRTLVCPGTGCNPSVACQHDRLAACDTLDHDYSAAFNSARAACERVDCKDLLAENSCLFPKMEGAPRTAAQLKLAADYCRLCANGGTTGGAPACEASFFASGSDFGDTVLLYGDALLAKIDATCLSGANAGDSCGGFSACLLTASDSFLPAIPASCSK